MDIGANKIKTQFKLLGIDYECSAQERTFFKEKAWIQAERRCKRIMIAVRKISERRKMVRMLVLPKVLWGAAWVRVPAKKIWDLRLMIERCVRRKWGSINSRSKMLIWETSLGCEVCPYFYAARRAVMLEQRRLSRELAGHEKMTITGKGNPMNQVCKKWNWTHLEGARYQTRDGVLNLAMDGKATIKSICRRAWVDWLWLGESRVQR